MHHLYLSSKLPRLALLIPVVFSLLFLLLAGQAARAQTTSYSFNGNTQTYVVPAGVTQLQVVATGAGALNWSYGGSSGATVRARVTVTPGEVLQVVIGQMVPPPGFGLATELRRTGATTGDYQTGRNALLVAGGGGGGGYYGGDGGNGGTPTGGDGTGGPSGTGATQTSTGTSQPDNLQAAGGGGRGYYDGGSGGSYTYTTTYCSYCPGEVGPPMTYDISGGGGGGSSWVMPTGSAFSPGYTSFYSVEAAPGTDGSLTITPVITPILTAPANGSTVATTTPTYTGTAMANSTVRLYVDGSPTPLTTTATSGGTFSVVQPTALSQGSHSVYATAQSSTAGVSAASATNTFTVAAPLTITALAPTRNLRNAPRAASVAVTFSQALQSTAATLGAVRVYSQQRGGQLRHGARATATVSGNTLTLDPTTDFKPGETLLVTTTTAATATGGGTLARGKVHRFTAATGGTGRGNFVGSSNPAVGPDPFDMAVGDVDGDGDLDLVTANASSTTVSVRLNGGDATGSNTGTFSNGSDPTVDNGPYGLALGDVDGDGDLDLLTANLQSNTVSVRLNGGNATGSNTGTFSGGSNIAVGRAPFSVAVGDVDGDGDLDLLTANYTFGTVSVRLNGGDASGSNTGVFSNGSDPTVNSGPKVIVVGDVDGDGDLDLLTANESSGSGSTVSVRLNGGDASGSNTGVFSNGSNPTVGGNPQSVAVGDVDGDGDLDLLTANESSGSGSTVSVRLNGG
ncbi:FG-GAP-like repeat-containing protein, partial [Hymenobacter sp. ASUV-10]